MQRYAHETGLRYEAPSLLPNRSAEFLTLGYATAMREHLQEAKQNLARFSFANTAEAVELYRHDAKHWLNLSRALRRDEATASDLR